MAFAAANAIFLMLPVRPEKQYLKKTEQVLDKAEGEYYNLTVLTHIVHEVQMCAVRESFVQHQNQERGVLQ